MRFCKTTLWIKKSALSYKDMTLTSFGPFRLIFPVSETGFGRERPLEARYLPLFWKAPG
jgi:hypothetical protein